MIEEKSYKPRALVCFTKNVLKLISICIFVLQQIVLLPHEDYSSARKMSIQTRGLVFATFFGNCLVVGLLVASLTTNYWVHSSAAKRHSNVTSREATGHLNFGLFSGYKELDVGFGNRPDTIDGMCLSKI